MWKIWYWYFDPFYLYWLRQRKSNNLFQLSLGYCGNNVAILTMPFCSLEHRAFAVETSCFKNYDSTQRMFRITSTLDGMSLVPGHSTMATGRHVTVPGHSTMANWVRIFRNTASIQKKIEKSFKMWKEKELLLLAAPKRSARKHWQ